MTSHDPNLGGARELFDRASTRLDQTAANRLRLARREALQSRASSRTIRGFAPMGAFAAAVLALGLAWWLPQHPEASLPTTQATAAEAEIDSLIVDEDPEVYAWLADAPVATHAGAQK